ncbi:hypothetical protein SI65_02054 [Aspergillus cristatus]|uniref:Uncharacterized protein n=1 Tax=Aspergillus cristatus TaxID=573508 RepID=A0A1E3BU11_ASPCR|nr:hypothetical protein SI65_01827 [Aspergillus cristatus]ODM24464.1 hypothetical protein SI65_02054 [Aspergillus cristatus]
MSEFTADITRKEPSTKTLLDQARERPDNVREELSDADPQNTTGVAADRSRAPVDQDLEKGSVQRAQVDKSSSLKS